MVIEAKRSRCQTIVSRGYVSTLVSTRALERVKNVPKLIFNALSGAAEPAGSPPRRRASAPLLLAQSKDSLAKPTPPLGSSGSIGGGGRRPPDHNPCQLTVQTLILTKQMLILSLARTVCWSVIRVAVRNTFRTIMMYLGFISHFTGFGLVSRHASDDLVAIASLPCGP